MVQRVSAPSPTELAGVRVLVVDDNTDTLALLHMVLSLCGAQVVTAASAREAYEIYSSSTFDVLVSDLGMPGEDGYSLLRKVRALGPGRGGEVPAVACTGFARECDRSLSLAAGFRSHLCKPVDPDELVHVVAELAGRA